MKLAAAWMNLEIIILREVSQAEKDKHHMISPTVKSKKNDTNELTYKTEIDPQTWKINLWLPKGKWEKE